MAPSNTTRRTTPTTGTRREAKPVAANANSALPRSKKERLRERLKAPEGASLGQLMTEFGWQPHTVRAAISGLRKAGLDVRREAGEVDSVYRIVAAERS